MLWLLQFYSNVNQIYVRETRHRDTYKPIYIFILCYLNPFKSWHDYAMIGTIFVITSQALFSPSEALGRIRFVCTGGWTHSNFLSKCGGGVHFYVSLAILVSNLNHWCKICAVSA